MRGHRGFTLLEIVVALAVTATTLVVLQRATHDAAEARAIVAGDIERRGTVDAALVHLARELGTADAGTLRLSRAPGTAAPVLSFAVGEPEPTLVRYALEKGALTRSTQPRFGLESTPARALPLVPGVRAFDLRARDDEGWHEQWEDDRVPSLLAVDLTLESGERLATTFAMVAGARR